MYSWRRMKHVLAWRSLGSYRGHLDSQRAGVRVDRHRRVGERYDRLDERTADRQHDCPAAEHSPPRLAPAHYPIVLLPALPSLLNRSRYEAGPSDTSAG